MNIKSLKTQFIGAIAMVLVAAIAMGSSTYAWFAMNNKVTVTGMEVKTSVGDNLLIANTKTTDTAVIAEDQFKTADVDTLNALLEPVSTTDGKTFHYNKTSNVLGNGQASNATYEAYTESTALSNTAANKTAYDSGFQSNYGISSTITADNVAYGFIDYAFVLKASNTTASAKYINLNNISLVYGTTEALPEHAYRTAVFVENVTTAGATGALNTQKTSSGAAGTLTTILAPTPSNNDTVPAYYWTSGKAVNSSGVIGGVTSLSTAANIATVAANSTEFYKVVVRLWLEGEDKTCNNTTFSTLKDKWALSLAIELQDATGGATNITASTTTAKADLTGATLATGDGATMVIDGTTYTKISTVQLNSTDLYVLGTSLTRASQIFTITGGYPIDVTNQCTLPTT